MNYTANYSGGRSEYKRRFPLKFAFVKGADERETVDANFLVTRTHLTAPFLKLPVEVWKNAGWPDIPYENEGD